MMCLGVFLLGSNFSERKLLRSWNYVGGGLKTEIINANYNLNMCVKFSRLIMRLEIACAIASKLMGGNGMMGGNLQSVKLKEGRV